MRVAHISGYYRLLVTTQLDRAGRLPGFKPDRGARLIIPPAKRTRYIVAFTLVSVLAALLLPAMPQPVSYHEFADQREMLGVENFLDVASNAAFVLAGLAGLAVVMRPRTEFASNSERWPYAIFFVGMVLTGLGSAYYHLFPDNERLFWDRLPMTIAFMSLIAAQVVDRIDTRTGLALLVPMLLVGAASVLYWRATERAGDGNVIPYAVLQGYSVVILFLMALLLPSRYTRGNDIYWVFAGYVIAKLLETFDKALFAAGHLASGHTLKHVAAAVAGLVLCRMLLLRQLQSQSTARAQLPRATDASSRVPGAQQ